MRTRTQVLIAGGVVGVAVLVLWSRPGRDAGATPTPTIAVPLAHDPDAARLARLELEIEGLRIQARRRGEAPPAVDESELASGMPDMPPPEPPPPPPDSDEVEDRYEAAFDADPIDRAWSRDTEAALAAVFAEDELAGSELVAARCRSTLCRIDVTHADATAQDRFLGAALHYPPFAGAGAARKLHDPDAPEQVRTLVFVARPGHALPTP